MTGCWNDSWNECRNWRSRPRSAAGALGAPDVGLTQLLVEALTILVIMLVLQKLPLTFGSPTRLIRSSSLLLALAAGVVFGGATWVLTGRRERSPVAQWYLTEGPEYAGADNIVNVILVEFRALDTLKM